MAERIVYLDNGATSYPKPRAVADAVYSALSRYGANAGRGAYAMTTETTEQIFKSREAAAELFNAPAVESAAFTYNCTAALNMAIKGLAIKGAHFIISDMEHNAVVRPLEALSEQGFCSYSVARVEKSDTATVANFEALIRKSTVAIICTGASNAFGIVPPYKLLGEAAHRHNIKFVLDAAQCAGILPVDMQRDKIDILCCAGHKGLYGPAGTGLLIIDDTLKLSTVIEGGTGSNSASPRQPETLPDRFESGTPNVTGIIALRQGIAFIRQKGVENIREHEMSLMRYLQKNLETFSHTELYTDFFDRAQRLAPILSFNVRDMHSEETAELLARQGIAVRAGLHCAPSAHIKMGTENRGTVRICPSAFTKKYHIDFLIKSLRKFAK